MKVVLWYTQKKRMIHQKSKSRPNLIPPLLPTLSGRYYSDIIFLIWEALNFYLFYRKSLGAGIELATYPEVIWHPEYQPCTCRLSIWGGFETAGYGALPLGHPRCWIPGALFWGIKVWLTLSGFVSTYHGKSVRKSFIRPRYLRPDLLMIICRISQDDCEEIY